MKHHYDIAICGAGLVGTSLSIALAQKTSLNILLFDSKAQGSLIPKKHTDTRTLALNACSQQLLASLGLWENLTATTEAIDSIQISEQGSFAKAFLTAADVQAKALGYVIEIADLHQTLQQALSLCGTKITVLDQTKLTHFRQYESSVQLELQQGETIHAIHADWLIAADSSQSFIREQLNIPTHTYDYQQTAIVSVLELNQNAAGQAFERFLKHGVLALLPLSDKRCGSVWVMPSTTAQHFLDLAADDYRLALQQHFGWQLGPFLSLGPRQHYPLQLTLAKRVIEQRAIIIGNAAHTLNPIGAQGLNLGLHDVTCLIEFFKDKLTIEQLSTKLLTRNQQLANLSDRTARLFALDCWPINLARHFGVLALEHNGPLKKHFTRRMMGY